MTTHKSDVWSACATVMNVLIGKAVNKEAQEQVCTCTLFVLTWICAFTTQISKFMTASTEGAKIAATSAAESLSLLKSIINLVIHVHLCNVDFGKMTYLHVLVGARVNNIQILLTLGRSKSL